MLDDKEIIMIDSSCGGLKEYTKLMGIGESMLDIQEGIDNGFYMEEEKDYSNAARMLREDKLRKDTERAASTGIAASALLDNASKLTSTNIDEIALGNYGNYIGPVVSKLLAIRGNYIQNSIERAVTMQQGQN